jgi:biofilm PGA synthesis lipoprotein PgaB
MSLVRSLHLRRTFKLLILASFLALMVGVQPGLAADKFICIVYHDIPTKPAVDDDNARSDFVKQLEFFRTHGYQFISPQDVFAASKGKKKLPEKAILLTFDDAYESFYQFVYPVLKLYHYPAVLSVVTSWIGGKAPKYYAKKKFMTWDQLREVAASGLVTIACHSYAIHKFVRCNPEGNEEEGPCTFIYNPKTKKYETDSEFRARIRDDLKKSLDSFEKELHFRPTIMTWPYGAYNELGLEEAKKLGFKMFLTLQHGFANVRDLDHVARYYAYANLYWVQTFMEDLQKGLREKTPIRAAQIDLDTIINPNNYAESNQNLGKLIDRLKILGVNTVFLQGYCDTKGTGNVSSLYFANSTLPVTMDFLSHAVNRIKIQDIKVFVWMPVTAFELPNTALNESLKVKENKNGRIGVPTSGYRRLTPFDPRSLKIAQGIFRDLAAHVSLDGILIQDDAYFSDEEDYNPAAVKAFRQSLGTELTPSAVKNEPLKSKWINLKTNTYNRYIAELVKTVKLYRPEAKVARNIYSEVITNPGAIAWFAEDYPSYLKDYDYTVIMAYTAMEKKFSWGSQKDYFDKLFAAVKKYNGNDKTVFKLQAYNWKKESWIPDSELKREMSYLLSIGVKNLGYYPDDVFKNKPNDNYISEILSGRSFVKQ